MPEQIRQALEGSAHQPPLDEAAETAYQRIFRCNRQWVTESRERDPEYFARRAAGQQPTFLFIGCSDSRVPAELLTGAQPGEMFVHRNVANLALHSDLNLLSVLQYAVEALKVKTIVVCGHYGCGGVRAALGTEPNGFVDHWLGGVRDVIRLHEAELGQLDAGLQPQAVEASTLRHVLRDTDHRRRDPVCLVRGVDRHPAQAEQTRVTVVEHERADRLVAPQHQQATGTPEHRPQAVRRLLQRGAGWDELGSSSERPANHPEHRLGVVGAGVDHSQGGGWRVAHEAAGPAVC